MRRFAALMLLPALLAACAGLPDPRGLLGGRDSDPAEPDRLAIAAAESGELPQGVPRLRLQIGGRSASAALIQQQGSRRLWRAPGGLVVATDGARVVGTAGLSTIITGTRFDGPDPLENPAELLRNSAQSRRLVDTAGASRRPETMRFGIAFDCRLRAGPAAEAGFVLIEERCRVASGPAVANSFWAEGTQGRITHAEQWVGEGLPMMRLQFP